MQENTGTLFRPCAMLNASVRPPISFSSDLTLVFSSFIHFSSPNATKFRAEVSDLVSKSS